MSCTFVTGPVRSGKSRFAERLAAEAAAAGGVPAVGRAEVTYVATARHDPTDAEWSRRIAHHRASRPAGWRVVETAAPGAPPLAAVLAEARAADVVLVDSLGTWLAARMDERTTEAGLEADAVAATVALLGTVARAVVVGEEVGWGIVPAHASARLFRDVLGRAQQRLAAGAERSYLVVAGFAIDLRAAGRPVDAETEVPRPGA